MDRRDFIKVCGGVSAACAGMQAGFIRPSFSGELVTYQKAKLVDAQGNPLKAKSLVTSEAYIFNYPMASTPCFLINLETAPTGNVKLTGSSGEYTWKGGVGPDKKIVAYAAICTHQLLYPGKSSSLINYTSQKSDAAGKGGVIVCCAHLSVFDPAQGAKVLAGAASQPLAAIQLAYDAATDELSATGVYGGTVYDDFFKAYKGELNEQYGRGAFKKEVAGTATAILMSKFSSGVVSC
jgi:Rieske Fe-S protein